MTEKDYLTHHGILGQKWGVRRYQNKDGTLTNAGRKRLNRDEKELNSKLKAQANREENFNLLSSHYKNAGPMAYARWYSTASTQSQLKYIDRGKKICDKLLSKMGERYIVVYDTTKKTYVLREKTE